MNGEVWMMKDERESGWGLGTADKGSFESRTTRTKTKMRLSDNQRNVCQGKGRRGCRRIGGWERHMDGRRNGTWLAPLAGVHEDWGAFGSGGVAALNHRLQARMPPASGATALPSLRREGVGAGGVVVGDGNSAESFRGWWVCKCLVVRVCDGVRVWRGTREAAARQVRLRMGCCGAAGVLFCRDALARRAPRWSGLDTLGPGWKTKNRAKQSLRLNNLTDVGALWSACNTNSLQTGCQGGELWTGNGLNCAFCRVEFPELYGLAEGFLG